MAIRFQTRLALYICTLIFLVVSVMTAVIAGIYAFDLYGQYWNQGTMLTQTANRNIAYGVGLPEKVIGRVEDQMIVQAFLTAELVALAERPEAATPEEISAALRRVVDRSHEYKGYPLVDEFRISDEHGRAYISSGNDGHDFDDETGEFIGLLEPDATPVVRNLLRQGGERTPIKYVGVSGVDKPRIVQVGAGEEVVRSIHADFDVQDFVERFMLPSEYELIGVVSAQGDVVAAVSSSGVREGLILGEDVIAFCREFLRSPPSEEDDVSFMPIGWDLGVVTRLSSARGREPHALFVQFKTEKSFLYILSRLGVVVIVGFVMFLFGILCSMFISSGLSKPIVQLAHGASEFGRGNLSFRLRMRRRDEFNDLAQSFNTMAISIQETMHELEQETTYRERLESEFRIAAEMQQTILPERVPEVEGLRLLGWSQPSREVGGDFYDFLELEPGKIAVIVGDATGKGVSAALLVTQCASILRTLAHEVHDPHELLERTNTEFFDRVGTTHRFVTLLLMVFDVNEGRLTYASAGHPPAALINACDGEVRWLENHAGYPLGIVEHATFGESEVMLCPQDTVVLYSDGLTDAQNHDHELYGGERVARLLASVRDESVSGIMKSLRGDAERHMHGKEPIDDMTIVVVRFNPKVSASVSREQEVNE